MEADCLHAVRAACRPLYDVGLPFAERPDPHSRCERVPQENPTTAPKRWAKMFTSGPTLSKKISEAKSAASTMFPPLLALRPDIGPDEANMAPEAPPVITFAGSR